MKHPLEIVPVIFIRDRSIASKFVRTVTLGRWHHCGIVDSEDGTIIEARPGKGVVETSITERVAEINAKGGRVEIVFFPTATPVEVVLDIARRELGKSYDWQGLVGRRRDDYWYCSELIAHALNLLPHIDKVPVVSPQELYVLGKRLENAFIDIEAV